MSQGVFEAQKKDGTVYYRASLTHHRKHISLGSFPTKELAGEAYMLGRRLLEDGSIGMEDYSKGAGLSFEKWVILLNVRDNLLYFSTPIYLKNKILYYYFDTDTVLKFDIDDLFYYSSHKIMRRGGRLFVSDYGSQVGIGFRYGIKNYAVEGVDYVFRNKDHTDFRRENLLILNAYHGVRYLQDKKCYEARIHINGYTRIGYYDTSVEAAIAYNKAVDLLQKSENCKKYAINFIDDISPREYANIYANVTVSEKIHSVSW